MVGDTQLVKCMGRPRILVARVGRVGPCRAGVAYISRCQAPVNPAMSGLEKLVEAVIIQLPIIADCGVYSGAVEHQFDLAVVFVYM